MPDNQTQTGDLAAVRSSRIVRRPSGWKNEGRWWTKDSQYGVRYMCPDCGKKALGTTFRDDTHHHWKSCPRLTPNGESSDGATHQKGTNAK